MTHTPDRAATSATPAADVAARTTRGPSATGVSLPVPPMQAEGPRPKRRPKDIGTDAERGVVRHLQANGFAGAERRALRGTVDAGDITGTGPICWEVKARKRPVSDEQIAAWMVQTEIERVHAGADIGVLVIRRSGFGEARAGSWWAVMPYVAIYCLQGGDDRFVQPDTWDAVDQIPVRLLLADAVTLLRRGGYGDPLPTGGEAA